MTLTESPAAIENKDIPMEHDYSLAHLTALQLTQAQLVDAAAKAGYRYVGLRLVKVTPDDPLCDLLADKAEMRKTKERLAATGVEVLDVELLRCDPPIEPETYLPVLEVAAELGAKNVIAQLPDPDRGRALDRFGRLCDLAKPFGIFVSLEFPHWTETGNLTEAARILRAASRGNAGMLVDMLHFDRSNSSLEELASLPREWFRFIHICDAPHEWPHTKPGAIHTARDERLFPGEGGIDIPSILARLPQDVPYALEIPRIALNKAVGPEEVARLALMVARSELDGVHYPDNLPTQLFLIS
jgi:sugar phosphate isomerase/epimerase